MKKKTCLVLLSCAAVLLVGAIAIINSRKSEKASSDATEAKDSEDVAIEDSSTEEEAPSDEVVMGTDLSYDGYTLKWEDDFLGDSLNRDDWNVELHEPGWVNEEWQAYIDSPDNIQVKDSNLYLIPVKTDNGDGTYSYTSGRVNTQNKHDFTYGLFEARVKVPTGMGYLPAFWMMPTNENLYGQWPRCGEIDCMEVMGQDTTTAHGTIHYGNPHAQSQGTYVLSSGNFSDEYHVFSCEWEPGCIKWYVDGHKIHEESRWYTTTEGQGTITYPAPFDQPFYIILNLAVGGSWVGYPDENTSFDDQAFIIDYVRAYQKDSYDDNVDRPAKEVTLREPNADGNYINNGDYSDAESLDDDENWKFMLFNDGLARASIADNTMTIATERAGKDDYSVQLVQANVPMEKGASYRVTFDAYSTEDRTMVVAVKAPDVNWFEYMPSTVVELTTEKQTYSLDFDMTEPNDANGRLEFNMGHTASTADIYISNVSLVKTVAADPNAIEDKPVLADGNYIYNGAFQEGDEPGNKRLGFWDITNNASATVEATNENTIRRLKIEAADEIAADTVIAGQSYLTYPSNAALELSFDVETDNARDLTVRMDGKDYTIALSNTAESYSIKFISDNDSSNNSLEFLLGAKGVTYLDNVRLVEDALIKNGSFNAGLTGFDFYADASADTSIVVDSLTEDNAADITINNTGDKDWMIQLKQNNVEMKNGQWYHLQFDIKANINRDIMYAIQRDGSSDDNWIPYTGSQIVSLSESTDYTTVSYDFQMTEETDPNAIFTISLGAVSDKKIIMHHRVCIDNIVLTEIEAPAE